MITHDRINTKLERLLARPRVQKQLRSGWHLHLACALRPPRVWIPAIRKLRKKGLTISGDLGWNPEVLESPQLPSLLQEFEFAFPNESEAKAITGEKTIESAVRKLARWVRGSPDRETFGPDGFSSRSRRQNRAREVDARPHGGCDRIRRRLRWRFSSRLSCRVAARGVSASRKYLRSARHDGRRRIVGNSDTEEPEEVDEEASLK